MNTQVINAGFPGDTTRELLARFDRDVAAHRPDWVVLLAGLNDMLYPGHTLETGEFERNLERLARRCADLGADLVLCTLPPVRVEHYLEQYPGGDWSRIAPAQAAIERMAGEHALPLADIAGAIGARPVDDAPECLIMNEANSGRRDGLHWTAAGCDAAARAVWQVLKNRVRPGARIVCFGDSLTYGVFRRGRGSARPDAETYPGRLAFYLQNGAD